MKMKTIVLASVLAVLALGSGRAYAQDTYYFGFAYTPVMPTGNTKDVISDFSWRGATMEGRRFFKPNMSLGFTLGWQVLNRETDEVISFTGKNNGIDIQGHQFRYINSFPLLGAVHYYFGQRGGVRPYIGGLAGITYMERRIEVSGFVFDEDLWPFTLAGDIGVGFPMGWRSAGFLFARYHWMAAAGNAPSQTYVAFGAGVAWQ